jgi:hypothetical protein
MSETNMSGSSGRGEVARRPGLIERLRNDRVNSIVWASTLLWGALVLAIDTAVTAVHSFWWDGGVVFLTGLGGIVLADGLYRLLKAGTRRGILVGFILGSVFLGVGIGKWAALQDNVIVAVVLVALAVAILLNAFTRRPS